MAGQIYSIQYKTLQTLGHKPFGVEGGGGELLIKC